MYGLANPVLAGGTVPRVWVVRSRRRGGGFSGRFKPFPKLHRVFLPEVPSHGVALWVGDDASELEGGAARHA